MIVHKIEPNSRKTVCGTVFSRRINATVKWVYVNCKRCLPKANESERAEAAAYQKRVRENLPIDEVEA